MNAGEQSNLASGSALSREQILCALQSLSDELGKRGITGEVCLFGGTVMVLAFTARLTTKDVDAIFQPTPLIRELARRISEEQRLPPEWLNDGVKGYLSSRHETTAGNPPQVPHPRPTLPVAQHLLALEWKASRPRRTTREPTDDPANVVPIPPLR